MIWDCMWTQLFGGSVPSSGSEMVNEEKQNERKQTHNSLSVHAPICQHMAKNVTQNASDWDRERGKQNVLLVRRKKIIFIIAHFFWTTEPFQQPSDSAGVFFDFYTWSWFLVWWSPSKFFPPKKKTKITRKRASPVYACNSFQQPIFTHAMCSNLSGNYCVHVKKNIVDLDYAPVSPKKIDLCKPKDHEHFSCWRKNSVTTNVGYFSDLVSFGYRFARTFSMIDTWSRRRFLQTLLNSVQILKDQNLISRQNRMRHILFYDAVWLAGGWFVLFDQKIRTENG